jgi:hypothetical protein
MSRRQQWISEVSIHVPAWSAPTGASGKGGDACVSIHAPARGATYRKAWDEDKKTWFQSTRPHGRDLELWAPRVNARHVSIHAPALGRDWHRTPAPRPATCFNPRARIGRDITLAQVGPRSRACFNPRAPTGRDSTQASACCARRSFNPRARTGRDFRLLLQRLCPWNVSIHAPAQGATSLSSMTSWPLGHAPARGRDEVRAWAMTLGSEFQSTGPLRARQREIAGPESEVRVSIHVDGL